MKYLLIALGLYGLFHYGGRYMHLQEALKYAREHPNNKLSPRIEYYAGRLYYQQDYDRLAQDAFTQLLTNHPTCQYAPSALLYLSFAAEENRDWDANRQALTRYIEEHENGKEIQLVRKRLEMLNYSHPKK